jgi:D-alanine-D-alanine ligase
VLLEMAGIPTLGSDALTLSLSLDKAWTNRAVAAVGVPVAPQCVVADADEARKLDLQEVGLDFPLFVKPRWEGSAKGIRASSRVEDRACLVREVARIVRDYAQPALVEAFLPGAEYTLAIVGNDPPRVLPVLQRALEPETRIGAHALRHTGSESVAEPAYCLPGTLTRSLEAELQRLALLVWRSLECRDFARLDFRLDSADRPLFLEINPLPTFAVDGTFAIQAELAGRGFADFLAEILSYGLRRLGLPERAAGLPRAVSR